jgi:transcriptional regulator with XRE-family HTH domain
MLFRHENITIAMVARGFTQKQLAIELEVSQGGLSKFISGELSVKPEFIEKLSEVLGYPISFFYEEIRASCLLSEACVYESDRDEQASLQLLYTQACFKKDA